MQHPPSFDDGRPRFDRDVEWLPPDTRAFQKASPGEYRLKSTGEVVADPDYTAMWTLRSPPPKKDAN
jgi:hypothetical protein